MIQSAGDRDGLVNSERFTVSGTALHGVQLVERKPRHDSRGQFVRIHCSQEFADLGLFGSGAAVQTNLSWTQSEGTIRGLHLLRPPAEEHKLLTCITGAIWDVVVDLRPNSPTWLQWAAFELPADGNRAIVVPPGVAHGFQVLQPGTTVLHLYSDFYRSELDAGVYPLDPELSIPWPVRDVHLSDRDAGLPSVQQFSALLMSPEGPSGSRQSGRSEQ